MRSKVFRAVGLAIGLVLVASTGCGRYSPNVIERIKAGDQVQSVRVYIQLNRHQTNLFTVRDAESLTYITRCLNAATDGLMPGFTYTAEFTLRSGYRENATIFVKSNATGLTVGAGETWLSEPDWYATPIGTNAPPSLATNFHNLSSGEWRPSDFPEMKEAR